MTEEITKLDNKYLVTKIKDLNDFLSMEERQTLASLLIKVDGKRSQKGKPINEYLVLNLDDEIDLDYFGDCLFGDEYDENQIIKVGDIAVVLVNAILKAKKG